MGGVRSRAVATAPVAVGHEGSLFEPIPAVTTGLLVATPTVVCVGDGWIIVCGWRAVLSICAQYLYQKN